MTTKRLWSYSQIRRWVGVLEYQPRELCGVQLLRQCSERAWPEHQGVEPVPTGTLKWCTATPEGIADPEGIVEWCDESLNIECQVDTKDVKLTIRTAWIHAVDRVVLGKSTSQSKSIKQHYSIWTTSIQYIVFHANQYNLCNLTLDLFLYF